MSFFPNLQFLSTTYHDAGVLPVPGELPMAALHGGRGVAGAHDVHHRYDQRKVPRTSACLAGESMVEGILLACVNFLPFLLLCSL